jgi:hypothetical protein
VRSTTFMPPLKIILSNGFCNHRLQKKISLLPPTASNFYIHRSKKNLSSFSKRPVAPAAIALPKISLLPPSAQQLGSVPRVTALQDTSPPSAGAIVLAVRVAPSQWTSGADVSVGH